MFYGADSHHATHVSALARSRADYVTMETYYYVNRNRKTDLPRMRARGNTAVDVALHKRTCHNGNLLLRPSISAAKETGAHTRWTLSLPRAWAAPRRTPRRFSSRRERNSGNLPLRTSMNTRLKVAIENKLLSLRVRRDEEGPRRLYILCWRELSRRRLLPAVSPAAGHLTTLTVAVLPGLCANFRPTTSKSSPI